MLLRTVRNSFIEANDIIMETVIDEEESDFGHNTVLPPQEALGNPYTEQFLHLQNDGAQLEGQ